MRIRQEIHNLIRQFNKNTTFILDALLISRNLEASTPVEQQNTPYNIATMTPNEFHHQLLKSTRAAVDFGARFITNQISSTISYDIEFNSSHDLNAGSEFSLYPEDEGRIEVDLDADKVVELLCRDGKVPAWIDISILKSSASKTRMNLMCAGRFTNLLQEMYYVKQGTHPFGIKSPAFPPRLRDEEPPRKFRLYDKRSRMGQVMNLFRRKFTYYRWQLKQK